MVVVQAHDACWSSNVQGDSKNCGTASILVGNLDHDLISPARYSSLPIGWVTAQRHALITTQTCREARSPNEAWAGSWSQRSWNLNKSGHSFARTSPVAVGSRLFAVVNVDLQALQGRYAAARKCAMEGRYSSYDVPVLSL